jgi:hypothetical protein
VKKGRRLTAGATFAAGAIIPERPAAKQAAKNENRVPAQRSCLKQSAAQREDAGSRREAGARDDQRELAGSSCCC